MSELVILLTRVLSVSKFSTILLKSLLKISAISTLSPILLLLLFKIMDSLRKSFSERKGQTVFQTCYCRRVLYGLVSQKKVF